jgi:hypothetical protein
MAGHDGEEDDELSASDWEGVTVEYIGFCDHSTKSSLSATAQASV